MTDSPSPTPLVRKLGIKPGFRIATVNAPTAYPKIVEGLPERAVVSEEVTKNHDLIHIFTADRDELRLLLPEMMRAIRQSGMIWVSWPKKASGRPSTVDGNTIRDICLPLGLVDVKVCSVNEVWSGLKLVIRVENRSS